MASWKSMMAKAMGRGLMRSQSGKTGMGLRDVLAALGFGCLLATLLIYSAAAMPFQRFESLPRFVGSLGSALQVAWIVAALVVVVSVAPRLRGLLASVAATVIGGLLYIAGNAMFCAMAVGMCPPDALGAVPGACIGTGCVLQCLPWGRLLAAYDLRRALAITAIAAVVASLAGLGQLALPEVGAACLFMGCTIACVTLPHFLVERHADGSNADRGERDDAGRGQTGESPDAERPAGASPSTPARASLVRTFLDVALIPSLGLVLFAVLMGMRGELFFEDYPHYVIMQVCVAAILFGCALLPRRWPLMRAIYRGLVPALAAVVLAVNYMVQTVMGGSSAEMALVILLYTVAALLALSTLIGMAHAAEFSADLIVAMTIFVFSLVTRLTQRICSTIGLDVDGARLVIVVTCGFYAAGMIVFTIWRGLRAGEAELQVGGSRLFEEGGRGSVRVGKSCNAGDAAGAGSLEALGPSLGERCDELATAYSLTGREREILGYLALGHSGAYIGEELLISPNTVRTHIHNIYRKVGVASREDIVRLVWE